MVEKLEHHGPVRLLEYGFKMQMVVIHMYKETSVLFYLISINLTIQSWGYLQQMKGFQSPKKVVISSKKYDIHKLILNLDTLNISPSQR